LFRLAVVTDPETATGFRLAGAEVREGRLAYAHNGARFMVTKPNDGKPASSANELVVDLDVGPGTAFHTRLERSGDR